MVSSGGTDQGELVGIEQDKNRVNVMNEWNLGRVARCFKYYAGCGT